MVMKNSKKEVNCDFVSAQPISKTQLKESDEKIDGCESVLTPSKLETGHPKPDTKIRIGPKENRTPNLYHFESGLAQMSIALSR